MPKAEPLTSKLRREAFQDEIAVVMTASLRSAVIKGCMPAVAYANRGLKIFEKGLADELFSQGAVGSVMPRGVGENNLPGRSGPKFCFASVKDRFWRKAALRMLRTFRPTSLADDRNCSGLSSKGRMPK
jgi:hypothetical protein